MGEKRPPVDWKTCERVARSLGFSQMKHKGTSHKQLKNPESGNKVTIPVYKEPFGPALFLNICRQMGISKKAFNKMERKKSK
jgi:predicted RNA binding protein YcfA (HicA-like mRNA interferase family)